MAPPYRAFLAVNLSPLRARTEGLDKNTSSAPAKARLRRAGAPN